MDTNASLGREIGALGPPGAAAPPLAEPPLADRHRAFLQLLRQRVDARLADPSAGRRAQIRMWTKVALSGLAFVVSYAALGLLDLGGPGFVAVYFMHGLTHFYILLNIGHDANHGAISRSERLAAPLRYAMDLCGISSYVWRIVHHRAHHYCNNVYGQDEAIFGRRLFRFSPADEGQRAFRYQHIYAPLAYCFASLDYVLLKDFEHLTASKLPLLRDMRHPRTEIARLIGFKALYLGYMIGAPILLFGYSTALVLAAFVIAHAAIGLLAMVVFQTTHLVDSSAFPRRVEPADGRVSHILATTKDVAPESRLLLWWTGGLNAHVIHHLFPSLCHVWYPELSGILRATAAEFGIGYRINRTLTGAIIEHLRLLRRLGRATPPSRGAAEAEVVQGG